ncbi:hypothetical protein [Roseovarius sp. M141]|uniref:hypothetical protein n=1 Tax=Roseovarius sp. M141 TaxID=2583806 RepID=UPI0020CECEAA|nr:hypothetical protein [Roseovarius sp. M141]
MASTGTQRKRPSAWPRPDRDQGCDPFDLPLPRYSGPQCSGHQEMPTDARAHMDRVLTFLDIAPDRVRWRWLDSKRHGQDLRLSWIAARSYHDPVQTWKHLRVRHVYDHIILREGARLELETPFGDPLEVYLHKLTMMEGSQITITGGACSLTIGQWVGTRDAGGDLPTILLTSQDGRDGSIGNAGEDGQHGSRDHPTGGNASYGAHGGQGLSAAPLHDCAVAVHTMTGHGCLRVQPGRGGAGGGGQPGGCGGHGGTIAFFQMGVGGDGGHGGDGGPGGGGATTGQLRLDFRNRQPGSDVVFDIQPGLGGPGGAAGPGGAGGIGTPDGQPGQNGRPGDPGATSPPPTIHWVNKWGEIT